MVTANRKSLAARAVRCFEQQTYANRELIVIDDGTEDYTELFRHLPPSQIRYMRDIPKGQVLGRLRNIALDAARGEYLIQWDDDDWYHPDRIRIQARTLTKGFDACCLGTSLMHLSDPQFRHLPYLGSLPNGIPGSIMHVRDSSIRYPEFEKAEDTVFLEQWRQRRYAKLPEELSHLFIRCYHGSNTWQQEHFMRRVRNSFPKAVRYYWYAWVIRDLSRHPAFRLPEACRQTYSEYLSVSRSLGLL